MKKVKLAQFVNKYINADNIKIFILFIPLSLALIQQIRSGDISYEDFFDTSILVSFLVAFLCEIIASAISKNINREVEDAVKLTEEYEALTKKYPSEDLLTYQSLRFPIVELITRTFDSDPFDIRIDHSHMDNQYTLPDMMREHYNWIMKAHSSSVIYNRWNVRLDDIYKANGQINLLYSKTMFYYSLATNRAMDYVLENSMTVRELYEPGPYLSTLAASKLSNHLGFNGFIETSDHKFIFVMRGSNLSIGKNTLAPSIGASLKTEYCLDPERRLVLSSLSNGIRKEIYDELKISIGENVDMSKHIFAFYRDIVEGGKPQFLVHYKLENISEIDFRKSHDKRDRKSDKNSVVVDGTDFFYKSLDDLKNSQIYPDRIVFADGTKYKMTPSAAASVIMLLKYYKVDE